MKRTSDSGRASSAQPASTSATSAFESLMSSGKHQSSAATATGDKQKDASTSSSVPKESDTASRISEQLVKQVEVNYSQNCLSVVGFFSCAGLIKPIQAIGAGTIELAGACVPQISDSYSMVAQHEFIGVSLNKIPVTPT